MKTSDKIELIIHGDAYNKQVSERSRIEHLICSPEGNFSICCGIICFSFADLKETKIFRHSSPAYSRIFVIFSGEVVLQMEGTELILSSGDCCFLPAWKSFDVKYSAGMRCCACHFNVYDGCSIPLAGEFSGPEKLRNTGLFGAVRAAYELRREATLQAAFMPLLIEFMAPVFPRLKLRARSGDFHQKILKLAMETPSISVEKMAEHFHISSGALSKSFSRKFRLPLKRFLMESRLQQAREQLLKTDIPPKELAEFLGFRDQSYFYRFFRRNTGVTPGEYRTNHLHEHELNGKNHFLDPHSHEKTSINQPDPDSAIRKNS